MASFENRTLKLCELCRHNTIVGQMFIVRFFCAINMYFLSDWILEIAVDHAKVLKVFVRLQKYCLLILSQHFKERCLHGAMPYPYFQKSLFDALIRHVRFDAFCSALLFLITHSDKAKHIKQLSICLIPVIVPCPVPVPPVNCPM